MKLKRLAVLTAIFLGLAAYAIGQVETGHPGDPFFWDRNTEADLIDYGVFRAEAPCTDATPTEQTCPGFAKVATVSQSSIDPITWTETETLVFVKDYYYRVNACNSSALCSGLSNELNIRWLNPNAPSIPGSLRKTEQGARIWIDWDDPPAEEHVAVWNVYKSTQEQELGGHAATVTLSEWDDVNPGRRGPRYYSVTAINDEGAESGAAGPIVYEGRQSRGR